MTEGIKTEDKAMHGDVTVTTSAKPMQIHFAGDPAGVSFDMEYARKAVNCHAELVSSLRDILAYGVDTWDATKHLDAVSRARAILGRV